MNDIHAYTAGYIDGDGCFYIGKTTNKKTGRVRYQAMLVISSTNSSVLKFFASTYGGSCFLSNKNNQIPGHKPQYQFSIKGKKAVDLAKNVIHFMVEKIYQCENFIRFHEVSADWQRDECIEWMKKVREMFQVSIEWKGAILKRKYISDPDQFDYAYLAGFIDAECCLSVHHHKPKGKPNACFKIILSCNNTSRRVFEYLIERWGGQLGFISRKAKNPLHKDQFTWRISGKALSEILPLINPHLRYKKPVCELLMEFYALTLKNGGDRHSAAFKQSYVAILESKINIVHKVHALNLKGIN